MIEQLGQTVGNLNSETAGLKKALRQPQTRGQWGELQLRRCVEIAGMTEHVDFELQETLQTEDGRLRPDARFVLPEGRSFVADSKVPLEAFLDAQEAEDETERQASARSPCPTGARARTRPQLEGLPGPVQGRQRCRTWSSASSRTSPPCTPRSAPIPTLFDYALDRNVLLVSPTSLIGLLRTMELGWRQERMVAEAAEIAEAAGTLHARFSKFLGDFEKVGKGLATAASAYDAAVGSMERRLLPQLRKVEGLGVGSGKEIEAPEPIEITVRAISAPELREAPPESDAA